jgi:hypothetical protein
MKPVAIAASICIALGSCGNANIVRHSGPALEATIDRSDRDALYVSTDEGGRYRVERRDVVHIRHPGSATGSILLLTTAALALVAFLAIRPPDPPAQGSGFIAIPRLMALTTFAVALPWGMGTGAVNLRSRLAASSQAPPAPPPAPAPAADPASAPTAGSPP